MTALNELGREDIRPAVDDGRVADRGRIAGFGFTTLDNVRNSTGSSPLCPRTGRTIRFGHAQRHHLTHLERHLKATAEQACHIYRDWSCDVLVLRGEERVMHLLESFLHPCLEGKIIGRIQGSSDADPRDRKSLMESALPNHKASHEIQVIAELREHHPSKIARGLGRVVNACNLFLVRNLIVNASLHHRGFICKEHHYLSHEPTKCLLCGKELIPVENLIDEIEFARLHQVNVTIVSYQQGFLADYEWTAAVVYVPTPDA